jgi:cytochrome c
VRRWSILSALLLMACGDDAPPGVAGGDAAEGRRIVAAQGCTACHEVPGFGAPQGQAGPSLRGFGRRGYVAGVLPNTPDNLLRFLRNPPSVAPRTAMPAPAIDEAELRHVAAFLVTLR